MAKFDPNKNPDLKKAWNEYGFTVKWEDLFDLKVRRDGCYCVVAWKEKDGHIEMADFIRGDIDDDWEVQNDGFAPIDEADWKKLRIVPECDWFVIPGNDDFRGLS